ncbi:DUF86 domain-containing protein [Microcystis aeruginosa LEGE 91341]|nr:DUF86 domain-containing protein [Microcystis aeruginosa LEGE 91341]
MLNLIITSYLHRREKYRFYQSLLIQDAMIRCFEVIGEAVKQLSPEIRKKYPEITWRKIAGFPEK